MARWRWPVARAQLAVLSLLPWRRLRKNNAEMTGTGQEDCKDSHKSRSRHATYFAAMILALQTW